MASNLMRQLRNNWAQICDEFVSSFTQNHEAFLSEFQQVYSLLDSKAEERLLNAERAIDRSPVKSSFQRPETSIMGDYREFVDDQVAQDLSDSGHAKGYCLMSMSIILFGRAIDKEEDFPKRFAEQTSDPLMQELILQLLEASLNGKIPSDAAAAYSYQTSKIYIFGQVKSDFEQVNISEETDLMLSAVKKFSLPEDEFMAVLRHEVTHAYLDASVQNLKEKEKARHNTIVSINEAAAHVVGGLTSRSIDSNPSSYRRQQLDISNFKTAENVFYRQAQTYIEETGADEEAAISFVRAEAAEAIKKVASRKNIDIAEALNPDYVRETKKLEAIIDILDRVDYYTLDMARFLGLENGERERKVVNRLTDSIEAGFIDNMTYFSGVEGWEPSGTKNFVNATVIDADEDVQELIEDGLDVEEAREGIEEKMEEGEVLTNFIEKTREVQAEIKKIYDEAESNPELEEKHPEILKYLQVLNNCATEVINHFQEGRDLDEILEELASREESLDADELKNKYFSPDHFSPRELQQGEKELEKELWKLIKAHQKFLTAIEWTRLDTVDEFKKIHGRLIEEEDRIERDFDKHANEKSFDRSEKEARNARYPSSPKDRRAKRKQVYQDEKDEFAAKLEKAEFEVVEEFVEITKELKLVSEYMGHIKLWCREWIEEAEEKLGELDFPDKIDRAEGGI